MWNIYNKYILSGNLSLYHERRKYMKKLIVICIVVAMLLSMVACTSNQATPSASTQAAASSAAPATSAAVSASQSQPAASSVASASASASASLTDGKTGKEVAPQKKTGKIKMGFCPTAMNTQYQMVIDGVKQYIQDNNLGDKIDLIVQAPTGQSAVNDQVNIIEGWIQQGFDVITMCTADDGALTPVDKAAAEKGIPIFEFNTPAMLATNPYFVSNVGYDQREAGHAIGAWMVKTFKNDINVAILEGLPGVHNTERLGGFNDALKESGETNIHVIASQPADWVRDKGQTVTENILQANPKIDVIWGLYDEMALGAVAACKESGRLDKIKIVGYDNTPDGYDAIKRGEMYATVDTASKQMGADLAKAVQQYVLEGQMVPKFIRQAVKVYDVTNIGDFDVNNYKFVQK